MLTKLGTKQLFVKDLKVLQKNHQNTIVSIISFLKKKKKQVLYIGTKPTIFTLYFVMSEMTYHQSNLIFKKKVIFLKKLYAKC